MGKVNETQMALAINAVNNDGMDLARAYEVLHVLMVLKSQH